jgi:N-acetylglucosaminyldiphosphoundecaprenol N-acetyl-beta-D-mannosaminyltransferase
LPKSAAEVLTQRHQLDYCVALARQHGYFDWETGEEAVIQRIARSQAGLSFSSPSPPPFQDGWIHNNLNRLGAKCRHGRGRKLSTSFPAVSAVPPPWMRAAGLEWFFRLLQEPGRFSRMMRLPFFVFQLRVFPSPKK